MSVLRSVLSPIVPPALQAKVGVPNDYIWRLDVDQYHEMIRAGILTDDDPVELLDGWLVVKMPKKPAHAVVTELTRAALHSILPSGWFTSSHEPITTDTSEPEPDVSVVRGEPRQYMERHPGPQDIGLLVEVSDTTLSRDQGWKKRLYAAARIPVYWIINMPEKHIEIYAEPTGPAEHPDYARTQVFKTGDDIPVVLAGQEIGRLPVNSILP